MWWFWCIQKQHCHICLLWGFCRKLFLFLPSVVLLLVATRISVNQNIIYLNTESTQPPNSEVRKEQHWGTPSYTDHQLYPCPCPIAQVSQALYHNSQDHCYPGRKFTLHQAHLTNWRLQKFLPSPFFHPLASAWSRELQAALIGTTILSSGHATSWRGLHWSSGQEPFS